MGEDGAKRVVVNSVGREIRTLEEDPPTEGKRLQLTIDYDVQKAIEDGFDAIGFNGAAVVLDPRNGEVLAFTSRAGLRPERVRRRHRSRDVGVAQHRRRPAAEGPRDSGALFARVDVQDGGGAGGARRRHHHAGLQGVLRPGHANFYGRDFKCWKKGGHGTIDLRHAIEQSCDVYFYTVGNMVGVDKINKWATLLGLGVKSGIDLPNEVQGLVPSTEWKREKMHEKWYAGETISVGIGQGQVSVTPGVDGGLHGDARQRRHARDAAPAQGRGRWQRVEAGAAAAAAIEGRHRSREAAGDPRRPVDGRQRRRHRRQRARMAGGATTCPARPARRRSFRTRAARRRRARPTKDLRDNGWFVFFAPRDNPQIAGVVFLEHGVHGGERGARSRTTCSTRSSRSRTGGRCRRPG